MKNYLDLTQSERAHAAKASHLKRLSTCHEVLADERGEWATLADKVWGHDEAALSLQDAALQALQFTGGDMMRAAAFAAERSRYELCAMGASRRCREHGLILADYHRTEGGHGESARVCYTVALRDYGSHVRTMQRLDRLVLSIALDAGLVGPSTRCHHSHDCCGHWYQSGPRVKWIAPNLFAVYQDSYQNV